MYEITFTAIGFNTITVKAHASELFDTLQHIHDNYSVESLSYVSID